MDLEERDPEPEPSKRARATVPQDANGLADDAHEDAPQRRN
jgi:hypothetical protein